jgi:signal transduction histidine kinase/FixJ family two-component response regulator
MRSFSSSEFLNDRELLEMLLNEDPIFYKDSRAHAIKTFQFIAKCIAIGITFLSYVAYTSMTQFGLSVLIFFHFLWMPKSLELSSLSWRTIFSSFSIPFLSLTYAEYFNIQVLHFLTLVSAMLIIYYPCSYIRKGIILGALSVLNYFLQILLKDLNQRYIMPEFNQNHFDSSKTVFFGITFIILVMQIFKDLYLRKITNLEKEKSTLETQNKYLKAQVEELNKELTGSKKSKDRFLLSLSHEFRNPINAALGNIELALDLCKDGNIKNLLINSKVSTEMFFHLVSNLLDASKIDNQILELHLQPHDLFTMVDKVWSIVTDQLSKKELVGEILIDMKIPQMIKTDSHFFKKILLNLILNAIKFTHRGSVMAMLSWIEETDIREEFYHVSRHFKSHFSTISHSHFKRPTFNSPLNQSLGRYGTSPALDDIPLETGSNLSKIIPIYQLPAQISLDSVTDMAQAMKSYVKLTNIIGRDENSPQKNYGRFGPNFSSPSKKGLLKIEIFDSGSGIDLVVAKNFLFKKFSTQNEEEKRLGTGLGLWLTKQLCVSMGGDIRVYSQMEEGSQFVLLIPVEAAEAQDIRKANKALDSLYGIQRYVKLRALVVDDDKYNRELNIKFLSKAGVSVEKEAINGEEAIKIFSDMPSNFFDLILMDIEMPVKNGKEATKEIRKIEQMRNDIPVQVVFATGNCDKSEYEICMDPEGEIRGNYFYRKPVSSSSFEEFVSAIKKYKAQQRVALIIEKDDVKINNLRKIMPPGGPHLLIANNNHEALKYVSDIRERLSVIFLNAESDELRPKEFVQEIKSKFSWIKCEIIAYARMMTLKNSQFYQDWLSIKKCINYPFEASDILGLVGNPISRVTLG